jgi:hypothetical protein
MALPNMLVPDPMPEMQEKHTPESQLTVRIRLKAITLKMLHGEIEQP